MELADSSLRDRLRQCPKGGPGIPRDELLQYMRESAEALDYLHSANVHHRDVKPENTLLLQKHVKVADFGLAKVLEGQRSMMSATTAGTPAYMAPEVWQGRFSGHSDQYSLAVMYTELRRNQRLYKGNALSDLMHFHTAMAPELDPLPEPEQRVLHKALAKNPNERFKTCLEFVQALDEAAHVGEPGGTVRMSLIPPKARPVSRRRWQAGAAVSLAVLVPLVLFLVFARPFSAKTTGSVSAGGKESPSIGGTVAEEKLPDGLVEGENGIVTNYPDRPNVEFVRVQNSGKRLRTGKDDLPTYYIMRNKVTKGLFKKFAAENPEITARAWDDPNRSDDDPVYKVSVGDACKFAKWLGGKLPTRDQWDKAAGYFLDGPERGEGPYRGLWKKGSSKIAVGPHDPMKAGEAQDDVSPVYGCRDMAGNGLEWTRDLSGTNFEAPLEVVDSENIATISVFVRGRRYNDATPLKFEDLEDPTIATGSLPYTGSPDPEVSFRVVIAR
jgi:hypothetical protein